MDVTKQTGEKEAYDPEKLCTSMKRAGVPDALAKRICLDVQEDLTPDVTTTKIFRETLRRLLKENLEFSARYSLRRAVDDLGPTGYLFEQYVQALLQSYGYETKRNVMMKGECVTHEVDVFAKKAGINFLVEAKYRNQHNIKTHIDQVMYADARLMDIERRHVKAGGKENYVMWVITNTKFTKNAIRYGSCREMKLVGWNYPKKENLEYMITRKKMYPVTVLPSMTRTARDMLTEKNLILAQDLLPYDAEKLKKTFGISFKLAQKLTREAQQLLS